MKGYINSFESFATLEGDGIRFAVFMQGCPLRCVCCHNPDTWALERAAIELSAEELVQKVLRYKPYFIGGGGVTFSGGEPLAQTEFLLQVLPKLRANGINVAIDTSCAVLNESVKKLYDLCDLVIADLKYHTKEDYLKHCRADVLNTVTDTLKYLDAQNISVWIRTVIIPGINDTKEHIDAYYDLVAGYRNIKKYELKPFHTMGFYKYEKEGIDNPLIKVAAMDEDKLDILKKHLQKLYNGASK